MSTEHVDNNNRTSMTPNLRLFNEYVGKRKVAQLIHDMNRNIPNCCSSEMNLSNQISIDRCDELSNHYTFTDPTQCDQPMTLKGLSDSQYDVSPDLYTAIKHETGQMFEDFDNLPEVSKFVTEIWDTPEVLYSDQNSNSSARYKTIKLATAELLPAFSDLSKVSEFPASTENWNTSIATQSNEVSLDSYYAVKRKVAKLIEGWRKYAENKDVKEDSPKCESPNVESLWHLQVKREVDRIIKHLIASPPASSDDRELRAPSIKRKAKKGFVFGATQSYKHATLDTRVLENPQKNEQCIKHDVVKQRTEQQIKHDRENENDGLIMQSLFPKSLPAECGMSTSKLQDARQLDEYFVVKRAASQLIQGWTSSAEVVVKSSHLPTDANMDNKLLDQAITSKVLDSAQNCSSSNGYTTIKLVTAELFEAFNHLPMVSASTEHWDMPLATESNEVCLDSYYAIKRKIAKSIIAKM